jgi:hypothetical protein
MKIILILARIIAGAAFLFSGTVKAIDPMGSAYKFNDYFQVFNMGFLSDLALPLAVLLCTVEFIAGFSLITGIMLRRGIELAMLLMLIFTPLTLFLALTNPVSDCGCFGDAVKLTNWQTFWKNIILITCTLILYFNRKKIEGKLSFKTELILISSVSLLFILFSVYNLRYLPVIDFLPYKIGANIMEQMTVPPDAEPDKYNTTFIYEKDGIQKEFDLSNYPAEDSSWKFVDQKSVLIEKGYQPPIHDFSLTTPDGEDQTEQVLLKDGATLLMIVKKMSEADREHLDEGFSAGRFCMNNGIGFYVLTASGVDEIAAHDSDLSYFNVDETTLKTMVRSNPGYILLEDGTITGKWSWASLPQKDELLSLIMK